MKFGGVAVVAGGIAVIAAILWFALSPVEVKKLPPDSASGAEKAERKRPKAVDVVRTASTNRSARAVAGKRVKTDAPSVDSWLESLPEQHRKLAKGISDASDSENIEDLKKLLDDAKKCPNVEVRQRMVEALGWFGKDALVELTGFLNDPNKEVAKTAFNAWDLSVDMLDDESTRVSIARNAMCALTDKDSLVSVAAKLEAAEDKQKSIEAIADIVESGNPAAADAAKDAYMFITGEAWSSPAQARQKAILLHFREK